MLLLLLLGGCDVRCWCCKQSLLHRILSSNGALFMCIEFPNICIYDFPHVAVWWVILFFVQNNPAWSQKADKSMNVVWENAENSFELHCWSLWNALLPFEPCANVRTYPELFISNRPNALWMHNNQPSGQCKPNDFASKMDGKSVSDTHTEKSTQSETEAEAQREHPIENVKKNVFASSSSTLPKASFIVLILLIV